MVPSKFIRSKAGRCVQVVLAALLFAGCTTQKADTTAPQLQGEVTATSAYYLQQMQQSSDDSKTTWQLLAVRALLKEGQVQQAAALFAQLPAQMSDAQRQEQALLGAEVKIAQKDFTGASTLLGKINPAGLSKNQQSRYYQAQIAANQNRPSLDLIRAYIAQEPLLQGSAHQKNIDETWHALTQLSASQLNNLVINADENTLQGWLDLLRVWQDNRSDADMMKAGIIDWQARYPQNPGAKTLPTALTNVQNFKPASTASIALLLPLSGQAQVFAKAIQDGFNAARTGALTPVPDNAAPATAPATAADAPVSAPVDANAAVSPASAQVQDLTNTSSTTPDAQTPATPPAQPAVATTAGASNMSVKVYDTSSQPLDQILQQAQQDGVSLVVGPLLKSNVEQLAGSSTSLNILALNQPEHIQNQPNICYYALSPEDEAREAAEHIWNQNRRTPLILVPRSAFGDRVSNAFAAEWQKLGGGTVLKQQFGSVSELKQNINSGSGIALTGQPITSTLPAQQSVTVGGLTIPAPPTDAQITGGNVDAVYMVATQDEVALLKPMIAMRTGSQSNIGIYASSRSSQGGTEPDFRLEMEGLQYSEIPMLAGSNNALMQQALSQENNDYSLARLYAMGADAWTLANHFSQMRQMSGYQISGNTGQLTANQDCVINRKLNWLQFRQGQIVPAS